MWCSSRTQLAPLLPALAASAARHVVFMFNTFEPLAPLREAVGAERFGFAFPGGVFTLLTDGRIAPQIRRGTTADAPRWAQLFSEAGIPTVLEDDMHAWLRSHAAMVAPLMAIGVLAHTRGRGIGWREAGAHADALTAGLAIVRHLGHEVRPRALAHAARLPRPLMQLILWAFSRTALGRDLGKLGAHEPRMLIDMMHAACPRDAGPLLAIRP